VVNRLLPDSPRTVGEHAVALLIEGKQRLRHILNAAISGIHITYDMWTSSKNLRILAIFAHSTSEKLQLLTVTLGLIKIEGEHLGLNQANALLRVIGDLTIRGKLGYFVMDNVISNDTLMNAVANSLIADSITYDPDYCRLRCTGHIINLVVQAFHFGREQDDYKALEHEAESPSEAQLDRWRRRGLLGKLHNIVNWILLTPQRI